MALTKPRGTWRYEDLFDLPDDGRRWEIIDGELFEMTGPASAHANTVMNLIAFLLPVVRSFGAKMFTAPIDVFFGGTDPVEPDLLVLWPDQLHFISRRGVEGAPKLLIEIVSPSNPRHDRVRKRALYARAGVLEYWLVDPEAATVEVLVLMGGAYETHIRATGDAPVTSPLLPAPTFPASAAFA